jgi:hypothetical protein
MSTLELLLTKIDFTVVSCFFMGLCAVATITSAVWLSQVRDDANRHQERMEELRQKRGRL